MLPQDDEEEGLLDLRAVQKRVQASVTAAGTARKALSTSAAPSEGSSARRAVRGAKAQASEKIRSQMKHVVAEDEEEEEEAENVAP